MDATTVRTFVPSFHNKNPKEGDMKYRRLGNTDMEVSYLSFGAAALGSVFRPTDDSEGYDALETFLKDGVNFIDTSPWYGHGKSERVLGEAFKAKNIPRQSFYIATKVGRYLPEPSKMFDFSYEGTLASVEESLQRLGLTYVDIIQAHDVEFAPSLEVVLEETLPALQKVKDEGKARYIGITGYPLSVLKEIVLRSSVKIDTVLTYCRYSMNDTALLEYKDFFTSRGVGIINASPTSMGLLTNRGPPDWHPAALYTPHIVDACKKASEYCIEEQVDISRLALHFSLEQPDCATCLISTASRENARKNLEVVSDPLCETERIVLKGVLERFMKPLNNSHWEGFETEALKKGEYVG
ncbi:uncharacterized protein [Watersipora subatra]|uniref:uncharacterized protein n=1 Tax=Watersipora subatra TaxID=2589382 RepID=UPI00355BA21A